MGAALMLLDSDAGIALAWKMLAKTSFMLSKKVYRYDLITRCNLHRQPLMDIVKAR